MRRLRRSRVLPLLVWLGVRISAPLSTGLAGRLTALLWFVPWQRRSGPASAVDVGAGPTVLLVHGWADDASAMAPLVGPLTAAGHRVVAVDLPAHGSSPGLRTDGFEIAQAIRRAVAEVGAEVVVAHSLGALATGLAVRDGLPVRGVVLLAPLVRIGDAVDRFAPMLRLPARAIQGLRRAIERRFGPDVWDDVAIDRHAPSFAVPALIVQDRDDPQVPVDRARRLAAAWPRAELVETSGLGHRRLLAAPEVADPVTRFVAGVVADADAREPLEERS